MKCLSPLTITTSEMPSLQGTEGTAPPRQPPGDANLYVNTISDIRGMIDRAETIDDAWMTSVLGSIRVLSIAFKQADSDTAAVTVGHLKGGISSDRDGFIETLIKVFELVFPHVDEKAKLKPCSLVKESVVIMIHALCNSGYASEVSQATVELVIGQCVDALLDDKFTGISCSKSQAQIGSILRAINKLAGKAATQPKRDTSLNAIIMLQQSVISAYDGEREPSKVSRVFTKLCDKVMREEHKKNSTNPLGTVDLESFVFSLDWLLQTIEEKRSNGISNDLVMHAEEMAIFCVHQLAKCQGAATLDALSQFEAPEGELFASALREITVTDRHENEILETTHPRSSHAESKQSQLAFLVHSYSTCSDGSDKQVALVALCDFLKANSDVDLETHLLPHTSLPFKMHLLEEVRKASKENKSNSDDTTVLAMASNEKTGARAGRKQRSDSAMVSRIPRPNWNTNF